LGFFKEASRAAHEVQEKHSPPSPLVSGRALEGARGEESRYVGVFQGGKPSPYELPNKSTWANGSGKRSNPKPSAFGMSACGKGT